MTALHEALAGVGGQLDTDIGHDATVLSMLALSSHRERAIELFVDMAERPRLDPADTARVKGLRLNRLRQLPFGVGARGFAVHAAPVRGAPLRQAGHRHRSVAAAVRGG